MPRGRTRGQILRNRVDDDAPPTDRTRASAYPVASCTRLAIARTAYAAERVESSACRTGAAGAAPTGHGTRRWGERETQPGAALAGCAGARFGGADQHRLRGSTRPLWDWCDTSRRLHPRDPSPGRSHATARRTGTRPVGSVLSPSSSGCILRAHRHPWVAQGVDLDIAVVSQQPNQDLADPLHRRRRAVTRGGPPSAGEDVMLGRTGGN